MLDYNATMKFTKMHGLGNDYIFVNCFKEQVRDASGLARVISNRHCGVGSDGLILICASQAADLRMEMYNADGSRAQMCGNGIRCVAKYAYEHDLCKANPLRVETDAGVKELQLTLEDSRVTQVCVDMGLPQLQPEALPSLLEGEQIVNCDLRAGESIFKITCVSMGNPHVVVLVSNLQDVDLSRDGQLIEINPVFPERINVHFVEILSAGEAKVLTWERGSGPTQACGTGACAVLVAGVLTGKLDRRATIHLPGGRLDIDWAENNHVFMTGSAVEVFSGEWQV